MRNTRGSAAIVLVAGFTVAAGSLAASLGIVGASPAPDPTTPGGVPGTVAVVADAPAARQGPTDVSGETSEPAASPAGPETSEGDAPPAATAPADVPAPAASSATAAPAPAPSTTTPAPPPSTTTPPPPPPTTTMAPPPPPPPTTTTTTEPESAEERVSRALETGVPGLWRAAIPVRLEVIEGTTSWAHGDGRILIAESHASARFEHLTDVVAHEFGHLIAFDFGSGEYAGAAPAGWPAPDQYPEEAWADCVQRAFTGRDRPSHGLPPCGGDALAWASAWLGEGPPERG